MSVATFERNAEHGDLFTGYQPRDCGEHRTVGKHRAWCFDCTEWCYSSDIDAGCRGCQTPSRDELIEAVDRVRALHRPRREFGQDRCQECMPHQSGRVVLYPCPTIRALDGDPVADDPAQGYPGPGLDEALCGDATEGAGAGPLVGTERAAISRQPSTVKGPVELAENLDRYITDEAVRKAQFFTGDDSAERARCALSAALPGILAAHRADVLREAADVLGRSYVAGDRRIAAQGILRALADEAVGA